MSRGPDALGNLAELRVTKPEYLRHMVNIKEIRIPDKGFMGHQKIMLHENELDEGVISDMPRGVKVKDSYISD